MSYSDFLARKRLVDVPSGIGTVPDLNPKMFPFQRDLTAWALRRGRCLLAEDCGLGKAFQALEWAQKIHEHTLDDVLIVAPLAVAFQFSVESEKFGYEVNYCRGQGGVKPGINTTNYEMLHHFDASAFGGVVLDESSILKSFDGKTRTQLIESFRETPYRLCCTATPAPNDIVEIGNHAEFLGVMTRAEMLSMFFTHDGGETSKWRLKRHAQDDFWRWMCSWAVNIRKPSDLGYDDGDFKLPELEIIEHVVESDQSMDGFLFPLPASSLSERRDARKQSLNKRVELAAEIANSIDDQVLVWCDLNSEADELKDKIKGAFEVRGSDKTHVKEETIRCFMDGTARKLVSKPSIFGMGLNLQNCHDMIFVGLSDSYEMFYQAVRRCWRFGQTQKVRCHVITSNLEQAVVANIKRKERESAQMADEMVRFMAPISSAEIKGITQTKTTYEPDCEMAIPQWL